MAELRQALHRLSVSTQGRGLVEITEPVKDWLSHLDIEDGLLTLYCRHTSASLLIQENADPDVCRDLEAFFERTAPEDRDLYVHQAEGPDDMPAHIRAALTQTQLSIPMQASKLLLGTWQGIYLFEHRRAPHRREVVLHLIGE
ncbi:MAG: secondary thiamine-phosphate synthase enzyme YjbQ [Methylovirgula sp.]|nr:secondary thiamine-phosphate synthase enzyme YjbQ [Methylovirgula sp.]